MTLCLSSFRLASSWPRALLAPALVFIATASDRNYQTDFWHHLARGRLMAEQGRLVDADVFTYTVAGQPFRDTNWLTQLLYHRLYTAGGLELVQVVNSLTLAAMMGLLVWLCRRVSGSLLIAGGVGVFVFLGLWQLLIIRPQTFSLLLFVILYAVLGAAERRRWLLLLPPAIMALWVNLHGGFPVGLLLIGAFGLAATVAAWSSHGWAMWRDGRTWCLAGSLVVSVLATLANPYGIYVYEYVGVTSTAASARRIDEWLPPGLDTLTSKVFLASVLLLLVVFALPTRRPSAREICLVLVFLPLALGSVRMVAWWLLVSAPILARLLAATLPRWLLASEETEPPSWSSAGLLVLLVLGCVLSLPWLENISPLHMTRSPHRPEADLERSCEQLRADGRSHRIFSRFAWSEYLGWRLGPTSTVFMDGRIEIFPAEVWEEYTAVARGRADWEALLARYDVDCLLLDQAGYHHELLPQVERSTNWERVGEAGDGVLFRRRALPCQRPETFARSR